MKCFTDKFQWRINFHYNKFTFKANLTTWQKVVDNYNENEWTTTDKSENPEGQFRGSKRRIDGTWPHLSSFDIEFSYSFFQALFAKWKSTKKYLMNMFKVVWSYNYFTTKWLLLSLKLVIE